MTSHWDEFSKSLAEESLPRRESLRRLGFLFAGTVLSPLGVGTAWARGADPCKTFCRCRNKSQQNACLAACNACNKNTSALCGSCGTYVCSDFRSDPNCGGCGINCAAAGLTCCGYAELPGGIWYCADLADDFYHCGSCGNACYGAGPNEYGACIEGSCVYNCNAGATRCNGVCTQLNWDPRNCGACGNVCPDSAPDCAFGRAAIAAPGVSGAMASASTSGMTLATAAPAAAAAPPRITSAGRGCAITSKISRPLTSNRDRGVGTSLDPPERNHHGTTAPAACRE